jgi:hypothetical protein
VHRFLLGLFELPFSFLPPNSEKGAGPKEATTSSIAASSSSIAASSSTIKAYNEHTYQMLINRNERTTPNAERKYYISRDRFQA